MDAPVTAPAARPKAPAPRRDRLCLSVSPHIRAGRSTSRIMGDVLLALLPASVAGVVLFGWTSLSVIALCVSVSVLSEALFNLIVRKPQTVGDLSAAVTGLLLALNLPADIPLWQAAVGSVFAIVVVKCLFGGLGRNPVNPAITARVFMLISFGSMARASFPVASVDAVSGATPLALLRDGRVPDLMDLFLGRHGGTIGETCLPALLLGAAYLLIRRVIRWQLPAAYVGTVFLLSLCRTGFDVRASLAWILSGGLVLGAFFMATDYVTSPPTAWGKAVFGVGAGLLTVLIRFYGNYPEGVSFSILLMNILNPYIERWTERRLFGRKGAKA